MRSSRVVCFFFQAEDGIRDLVRSRGLGDVYKRQEFPLRPQRIIGELRRAMSSDGILFVDIGNVMAWACLLYTSDAADERSSVDLGGRRIIKKKKKQHDQYMLRTRSIQDVPSDE